MQNSMRKDVAGRCSIPLRDLKGNGLQQMDKGIYHEINKICTAVIDRLLEVLRDTRDGHEMLEQITII